MTTDTMAVHDNKITSTKGFRKISRKDMDKRRIELVSGELDALHQEED